MSRRRRGLLLAASPIAAFAVYPGTEDSPSGLKVLRLLAQTRISSLLRHGDRRASYEVTVPSALGTAANVHICGVCHVEKGSVDAARDAILRYRPAAVALECDATTLQLLQVASAALDGVPVARVRANGPELVREALSRSDVVKELALQQGTRIPAPSSIGLPPVIGRHLSREGVLWSDEMRAAAAAADQVGARVICLGPIKDAVPPPPPGNIATVVGMAACWLRARALRPGLDERSCEPAGVAALNRALHELLPAMHRYHVSDPDALMAKKILSLCNELANPDSKSPRQTVVAVVGAQHVPGLEAGLKLRSDDG